MKKIFTLISVALCAMSVNAQEDWDVTKLTMTGSYMTGGTVSQNKSASYTIPASAKVFPVGTYVDGTTLPEAVVTWLNSQADPTIYATPLNEITFVASTTNVTLKGVSTPNSDKTAEEAWNYAGTEDNKTLSLEGYPTFKGYIKGNTGNPSIGHYEFVDLNSSDEECSRVADAAWAPGLKVLPGKGCYYEITAKVDGTMIVGIWLNKNLASNKLCVIDESSATGDAGYSILTGDKITVKGFRNDNGWEGEGVGLLTFPVSENGLLQLPEGATQTDMNRPLFAYVTWEAKKDVTYMLCCPTNQLGIMGFRFTAGGASGINTIKAAEQNADAPIYNLSGQKVDKSYKGIVIQNGRKFFNK